MSDDDLIYYIQRMPRVFGIYGDHDLDCVNQIVDRIKSQEHLIKNLNKAIDQREKEIVSLRSSCDNLAAENNMLKRKLMKGESE